MTSHTIRIGLGLIALSPVALSQDAAQLLDDSHAWTRTGAPLVLPPAPATSSPGHITVYYTNIATSPSSDVPGLVGTKFTSGNVTTAFDHQWFSPDGVHYVFRGDTPLGTTLDAVVIRDGALLIDSIGTASVANDTLVLQGSQVPNGPGLYFRGTSLFAGPGLSFGDGLLCAGGTIIRMGVVFASGNVSSYPGGTTPAPVHTAGLSVGGDTHYYQLWYRDGDTGYCTSAFYNLTNAVECVWGP